MVFEAGNEDEGITALIENKRGDEKLRDQALMYLTVC